MMHHQLDFVHLWPPNFYQIETMTLTEIKVAKIRNIHICIIVDGIISCKLDYWKKFK